jgi:hypothetical protein
MVKYGAPNSHHDHVDTNKNNFPCPKYDPHNCKRLVVDLEGALSLENMQVGH